jgi:hypothetical protein
MWINNFFDELEVNLFGYSFLLSHWNNDLNIAINKSQDLRDREDHYFAHSQWLSNVWRNTYWDEF